MAERKIPSHWRQSSWEEKARENPFYAVMTVPEFQTAGVGDADPEQLEAFFEKGRFIYARLVEPHLEESEKGRQLVCYEYGCGLGRVLRAIIEKGHRAIGVDISASMLENCRRLVPEADTLYLLDSDGHTEVAADTADIVVSYSVLQHISTLSAYETAVREMARVLRPDGLLAVQVNCHDFEIGTHDRPGFTLNQETRSIHYEADGVVPCYVHPQDNWSGVYIGIDLLARWLKDEGISIVAIEPWSEAKPRSVNVIGRMSSSVARFRPRPLPFHRLSNDDVETLMSAYADRLTDLKNCKRKTGQQKKRAAKFKQVIDRIRGK